MAAVLANAARAVLLLTLAAAPWLLSGYRPDAQAVLCSGVGLSLVLWLISAVSGNDLEFTGRGAARIVLAVLLPGLLIVCVGVWQLYGPPAPATPFAHAVFPDWRTHPESTPDDPVNTGRTLCAAVTRSETARLLFGVITLFLAAELFGPSRRRWWLWGTLAGNGVLFTIFALVQRFTSSRMIYWSIELPPTIFLEPFGSYVNRNAASNLMLSYVAAGLGLVLTFATRSRNEDEFQRLDSESQSEIEITQWWERLPALVWTFLLAGLVGGVISTLSRAGIAAMAAALVATLIVMMFVRLLRPAGQSIGISLLLGLGVASGVGMYEAARDRFQETFSPFREFTDARVEHWTYMMEAVRDWPILGSGLGTYQYMNAAYQRRAWGTVWLTADGQYIDLLVEGGLVSASAALLGVIGILAAIVLAFRKLKGNASVRDIGPVLVFVLLSQGLQLAADSSLVHQANLLTLAALIGGLLGGLVETTVVAEDGTLISHDTPRRRNASLGLCMAFIAGGIVGGIELISTASVFRFVDFVNRTAVASPRTQSMLDTDLMLQRAEYWNTKRPDDPLLHRAWSKLLQNRYQLNMQALLQPRRAALGIKTDDELWARSSVAHLYAQIVALEAREDAATLESIRREPLVEGTLKLAGEQSRLAKRLLGSLDSTDLEIAVLLTIQKNDPVARRAWMKHAAFCEPAQVPLLIGLISICESPRDDDIAKTLLRHLANLPGASATAYLDEAFNKYPPELVLNEFTPQNPEALAAFGRHPRAGDASKEAMTRAADMIEKLPELERSWRTWLLLGETLAFVGDMESAEKACREANKLAPWSAEPHSLLADVLERQKRFEEAQREIENAIRLAPDDSRLRATAARLLRLMTEAPRINGQ